SERTKIFDTRTGQSLRYSFLELLDRNGCGNTHLQCESEVRGMVQGYKQFSGHRGLQPKGSHARHNPHYFGEIVLASPIFNLLTNRVDISKQLVSQRLPKNHGWIIFWFAKGWIICRFAQEWIISRPAQ